LLRLGGGASPYLCRLQSICSRSRRRKPVALPSQQRPTPLRARLRSTARACGAASFVPTLILLCSPCLSAPTQGASDATSPAASTNLLLNGDFETTDASDSTAPAHWDKPDGLGVRWVEAAEKTHGKTIRMDTAVSERDMVAQWKKTGLTQWDIPEPAGGPVAATYGLSYYSDWIPVKSGHACRVSFDFKGHSGGAKVWVRGYGEFRGQSRRRQYETIVNCRVPGKGWYRFTQVLHPTKRKPAVSEIRVMLYAYWPPGVYWFDNVTVQPIPEAEYEKAGNEAETPVAESGGAAHSNGP
jgi:hypothetical protein